MVASPDTTIGQLNALHARREQGIPTVAVLVGPAGLVGRAWSEWNQSHGREVTRAAGVGDEVALALTEQLLATEAPDAAAVEWLAGVQSRTSVEVIDHLSRMTRYDFEHLWPRLPVDIGTPTAVAARATLVGRVLGHPPDPARWVREVTDGTNRPVAVAVVDAWYGLLPDARRPALLFTPPAARWDGPGWLSGVLRGLEPLLEAVPRWPVAVAVSDTEYLAFTSAPDAARHRTLAREGFVPVRGVSEPELVSRLAGVGEVSPSQDTLTELLADGLSEETAAAFVATVQATREQTADAYAADNARSQAERFLYQHLNDNPATAGLFQLNRELDFRHGNRPAEADLVSLSLRVVIEVDGGYYHLNPEQYRRDRKKDWLYQTHGYLVLRFLAEDINRDLASIRAAVAEAVALRRSPPHSEEVT